MLTDQAGVLVYRVCVYIYIYQCNIYLKEVMFLIRIPEKKRDLKQEMR